MVRNTVPDAYIVNFYEFLFMSIDIAINGPKHCLEEEYILSVQDGPTGAAEEGESN